MGEAGEGQNINHQLKKMSADAVRAFRDRFSLPVPDDQREDMPYLKPAPDSEEARYFAQRRAALGGYVPSRSGKVAPLAVPPLSAFATQLKDSGERGVSTTMSFVRILTTLLKDPNLGKLVIPIVPDESRTFGMEGLFRQIGIHSYLGQLYTPQDAGQLSYYKEAKDGQILQEGINESGAISSWIAAGTAYSNHGLPAIPFYIFYSMFGLQRVGDLAWAAADARTRGFLLGATSGRTTLAIAMCCRRSSRTAFRMTRPMRTNWRSSSRTACGACTRNRKISITTSPCSTRTIRILRCPKAVKPAFSRDSTCCGTVNNKTPCRSRSAGRMCN